MPGETTAIIPARGGSKGVPRKNLLPIAGKPLIAWTIEQALEAKRIDSVYVSTEDEEIADVSRRFGARVIARPPDLAGDDASSESVLLHAAEAIEREEKLDLALIVFLQATSPLRYPRDLDRAVEQFTRSGVDSLFSGTTIKDFFVWEETAAGWTSASYDFRRRKRRQEIKPRVLENGSLYIFTPALLRRERNRLGGKIGVYEMPYWQSFQLDEVSDLPLFEYYLREGIMKENILP